MNGVLAQYNSTPAHTGTWTTARLVFWVVVLFIGHVCCIVLFAERGKHTPREVKNEPRVLFVHERADALALADEPTLFVLAGPHTFSGHAWFSVAEKQYPPFEWTEPPAFLALPSARLGAWFVNLINGYNEPRVEVAEKNTPDFAVPPAEPNYDLIRHKSVLTLGGDIAARRLLSQFDLPSWRTDDVLRPTIVRVVVDASGQVHSATLISSSGFDQADKFALDTARAAEWEPLRGSGQQSLGLTCTGLSVGTMIFSWHTIAGTATNTIKPVN